MSTEGSREHVVRTELHRLYAEQNKRKQRVSEIDLTFSSAKRGGAVVLKRERGEMQDEKQAHIQRLQEIRQEIRDLDYELRSLHLDAALVKFGDGVTITATLKAVAERCGKIEHVYMTACSWADDPCERTAKKLQNAIRAARGG